MADCELLANDDEDARYTMLCLRASREIDLTDETAEDQGYMLLKLIVWSMSNFKCYGTMVTIEDQPAYEFIHSSLESLETECVYREINSDGVYTVLVTVANLLLEFHADIQAKTHNDQLERFRRLGLHGMHGNAARRSARLNAPVDHSDCVVCLDSDSSRDVNVSSDCQHESMVCRTCVTKLDKCPVCNAPSGRDVVVEDDGEGSDGQ
jgi:hypothetical protein